MSMRIGNYDLFTDSGHMLPPRGLVSYLERHDMQAWVPCVS